MVGGKRPLEEITDPRNHIKQVNQKNKKQKPAGAFVSKYFAQPQDEELTEFKIPETKKIELFKFKCPKEKKEELEQ